jgi:cytochrome oxidase Cu insertion factor (SCO1/SenC/PrrC family)
MARLCTMIFLLALVLGFWPAAAGLAFGPADEANLPPTDLERIQVGQPAPDFILEDEKGAAFTLSQFREHKNVVLVFYRGHW